MRTDYLPWSIAWQSAAAGDRGFYRRHQPADHFETNVMFSMHTADRLGRLVTPTLEELIDRYGQATLTDVGAADGQLLTQLAQALPADLASRVAWRAVDLRPRPLTLPPHIQWLMIDAREFNAHVTPAPGIVIAHELLDDIPCDVLEIDDWGRRRIVLVDVSTGHEVLGPDVDDDPACQRVGVEAERLRAWCDLWWPRREPAARVEVGVARDEAWCIVAGTVHDGLAIAIDYGHVQRERDSGRWDAGTLSGFRTGRVVRPVPDGSANITAHVALDSCAAAADATTTSLTQASDGLWHLVQRMGR